MTSKTTESIVKSLGFDSLLTRNSDSLDFKSLHVGNVIRAIDDAYAAGSDSAIEICAKTINQLESDAMTMALRLLGESDDSFAPETREVMARWRPKVEAVLRGDGLTP